MANDSQRSDGTGRAQTTSRRTMLRWLGATGVAASGFGGQASAAPPECPPPTTEDVAAPKPGPDILYADQPAAPQLEPTRRWTAEPLWVSGTDGYDDGEYLYQDYVYDDNGANTTDAPAPPNPHPQNDTFSPSTGDVVYPTDGETFAYNAADLLEFRVQSDRDGVAYRIALQTMAEPDVAGVAIGIDMDGTGGDETDWGYGIGSLGPLGLDYVLVTWGTGAELVDVATGATMTVPSSVDTERNQIEVTCPLAPDGATWRHYVAVGLFDVDAMQFRQIQEQPDATNPGGAHGQNPPPIFNVGFRFDEPLGGANVKRGTVEREVDQAAESRGTRGSGYGHWREHDQARALAARDISDLHTDIDFARLGSRTTERHIPETGYMNRVYASQFELGEGVDLADGDRGDVLANQLQPYSLYVPESYSPDTEHPLHVHMHGYTSSYSEPGAFYPNYLRELGEDRDALVLVPEARGPGLSYENAGELDVVEAMRDVANRYSIDFDHITLAGYSMGGYGTFTLAGHYPDLVAKGFPIVGAGDERLLDNLRHVPILMWNASNDELVPATSYLPTQERLRELGYRHELDVFLGYDHFTFGFRDQWGPAKEFLEGEFLGDATVTTAPSRVTYRRVPEYDVEAFGLVHDKAYWVADIRIADGRDEGLIDAHSKANGNATPVTTAIRGPGTDPDPHMKRGIRWAEQIQDGPPFRPANAVAVDLDGVTAATLYIDETDLDPTAEIALTIDATHDATITLVSGVGTETVSVSAGHHEVTVHLC